MSVLIDFYSGSAKNSDGRTLHDVWAMSDDDLMETHDVVQWLFPLTKQSNFNPGAPILSQRDITLFHENPELWENLLTSFHRFLKVFGVRMEDGEIVGNADTWIFQSPNHNWLRFTRIMESLTILGLPEEARKFHAFIVANVKNPGDSLDYWNAAI